ncbi:MAG: hypothetical protein H6709_11655 [Kofleriaceae bacterium]|nr:hypothetical protein [Myxococcales bacterium]MCB9562892.1 hypothetical protein [Kofleriaceae bacterium]MCB9572731.1 hypothetical protein [Kofleriaceae bacterium]
MSRLFPAVLCALLVPAVACGKKKEAAAPPPAQPATGAPIAFEVTGSTPGGDHDGKLDVKAYNFSDKSIAGYTIAARYTDAAGAVIKVGVGTAFEKDVAWTSFSGRDYLCKPKSWCTFEIEMLEVPKDAAKTEVMLTSARALKDDGMHFEEDEAWKSGKGMGEWPIDE